MRVCLRCARLQSSVGRLLKWLITVISGTSTVVDVREMHGLRGIIVIFASLTRDGSRCDCDPNQSGARLWICGVGIGIGKARIDQSFTRACALRRNISNFRRA